MEQVEKVNSHSPVNEQKVAGVRIRVQEMAMKLKPQIGIGYRLPQFGLLAPKREQLIGGPIGNGIQKVFPGGAVR